ncbi:hypothetical protein BS47DRAFT_1088241 [Hydnum rufescens UP504]|uniref:Uncharacterized protein n=1 Tax=Hydnum rufescens UP504 TaxID=1448309 RepID=A0A9P6DV37_9AGAM|nr:hypothetical protein BS47DRAFT_1088241 [Hydnum rufescens UP504]
MGAHRCTSLSLHQYFTPHSSLDRKSKQISTQRTSLHFSVKRIKQNCSRSSKIPWRNGLQQDDAIYRTIRTYYFEFQRKTRCDIDRYEILGPDGRLGQNHSMSPSLSLHPLQAMLTSNLCRKNHRMAARISEHHMDLLQSWTLFQARHISPSLIVQ